MDSDRGGGRADLLPEGGEGGGEMKRLPGGEVDVTEEGPGDTDDGPTAVESNVAPPVKPSRLFGLLPIPVSIGRLFGPVSSLMSINGLGIAFEFTLARIPPALPIDRTDSASDCVCGFERFEAALPGRLGGINVARGALSESSESESESLREVGPFEAGRVPVVIAPVADLTS